MKLRFSGTLSLAALAFALATSARADETGNFLVRIGQDTLSVERYTRGSKQLEIDQVGRSPRVLQRHFTYTLDNGAISKVSVVVTAPGTETPFQTIESSYDGDSLRTKVQGATGPAQNYSVAAKKGAVIVSGSSPWSLYETQTMKLAKSKADTTGAPLYFLGASSMDWVTARKLGRDSATVLTGRGDVYNVKVDGSGRITGVRPIAGTQKFSVERLAKLDVPAMATAFAAREKAGTGLGTLSPRDTVRADVGGAAVLVDYGRPAKRGRVVFGQVVPYGEVWRTGANSATTFRTDKPLDFSGTVVPAGTYTLWTVPTPTGWTLIVNSETGEWGTQHKPEKDLYKINMQVSSLPQVVERFTIGIQPDGPGGTLNMDWDTTRASVAFQVKP